MGALWIAKEERKGMLERKNKIWNLISFFVIILNFKLDTLCEVQGSIFSFFWLHGPPRCLVFKRILSNHQYLHDHYDKNWRIWWCIRNFNFKCDTLCKVQDSTSSFFWLLGPPDVLYLKEYYQSIIIIMMNVIRNEE